MPEQLALEQGLGDGGAVDRDKRAVGAWAVAMNSAGHELLAGPAFAGDEHGRVRGRDTRDAAVHLAHRRAFADHVVVQVDLGLQPPVRALERLHLVRVSEGGRGHAGNRHTSRRWPSSNWALRAIAGPGRLRARSRRSRDRTRQAAPPARTLRALVAHAQDSDQLIAHPVDHRAVHAERSVARPFQATGDASHRRTRAPPGWPARRRR